MAHITIYQKPTCTTCRQVVKLVESSKHPFTAINYYEKPFTKSQLKMLLKKARLTATAILRTKEEAYKKLNLAKNPLSEDELIDRMIHQPDLIQRPLVEKGETVILARPPETIKKLL